MKRPILLFLAALSMSAFFVACNKAPTEPTRRSLPPRPSFALDVTPAATPTAVSAEVIAANYDGLRDSVRVTWIDNETRLDEFVTNVRFTGAAGEAVTTQSAYASAYDQPVGSTGERTATVITPTGAAAFAHFRTSRRFLAETLPGVLRWRNIWSAESGEVEVTGAVSVTVKGKKK